MKSTRYFLAALAALTVSVTASAQSKSFTLGKWVELHNAILKELNRSYVDSLEVGRIEREGVDAMLSALDPYTVYVPEEEQEDFQMMLSNTYGGIGAGIIVDVLVKLLKGKAKQIHPAMYVLCVLMVVYYIYG